MEMYYNLIYSKSERERKLYEYYYLTRKELIIKTLAQLQDALRKQYDGPLKEKAGFSYVPWNEAVSRALQLFDADGFDIEIISTRLEEVSQDGKTTRGYSAVVRVSVSSDSRRFYRDGLGFNELTFTTTGVALIDTAIKGAVSNAILRALVLLGDAFGLFLYGENKEHHPTDPLQHVHTKGSTAVPSSVGERTALSEKQQRALHTKGFTHSDLDQIAALPWQQRKSLLDEVFSGGDEAVEKYHLTDREEDGYPF